MRYSETGIKYVENLTDYSRKQIIEMLQNKGNYTKYNQEKVTTLYMECARYPTHEENNEEIVSKEVIEKARKKLLDQVSLNHIVKTIHCAGSTPSYFTRLKLDKLSYSTCKKMDNYLKDTYNFNILKECNLPEDYFEKYYKISKGENTPIQEIAEKFGITYNYATRVINRIKTTPTFEPRTKDSKKLNEDIKAEMLKRGML